MGDVALNVGLRFFDLNLALIVGRTTGRYRLLAAESEGDQPRRLKMARYAAMTDRVDAVLTRFNRMLRNVPQRRLAPRLTQSWLRGVPDARRRPRAESL